MCLQLNAGTVLGLLFSFDWACLGLIDYVNIGSFILYVLDGERTRGMYPARMLIWNPYRTNFLMWDPYKSHMGAI